MKIRAHIDKLKICYTTVENGRMTQIMNNPSQSYTNDEWGFRLERIESKHYDYSYAILYQDCDGIRRMGTINFGLVINKDNDTTNYIWIQIDNKQFYENVYPNVSNLIYLEHIEWILGLKFNNITQMDVAIDGNKNWNNAIRKALHDKTLRPIINGKLHRDPKKIVDGLFIGRFDLRRIRETNYLFALSDKSIELGCYNKSAEILKSGKTYIFDANGGHNTKQLFRMEIRVKHPHLHNFMVENHIEYTPALFVDEDFLYLAFNYFTRRVLRFRDQTSRKTYDLLDMVA